MYVSKQCVYMRVLHLVPEEGGAAEAEPCIGAFNFKLG